MKTLLGAVLISTLTLSGPAAAQTVDVTGKWNLSVATSQGERPGTLTISRSGDTLSGTVGGPGGNIPADVVLKETAITITVNVQTQNGALAITMSGTVDGNTMKGDVAMGDRGSATWTATRADAGPSQSAPAQEKPAATISGTWAFEVHHSAGVSTPTVTISEKEGKLTGKYVGSYGESELTGTIKGDEFTFTTEIGTEQKVKAVYTGTLAGDSVKGAVSLGELGEGTFTGKRK